ncbi:hypothetical protein TIFTF001_042600 [Ficus carica]|uniref:NB-ARC domain-containing protein n=1 Tax=Ficus carica TaxID=3494 RepID=A0AA87ZPT2_FICCA|nr:hypothetical protein TIFTF001_042599 [Ficus carica]GMN37257.1 hypothetical protein TIFTF001_042600 [Ficus carica]
MFIVRFNANLNDLEKATGGLMDRKNDIEQQLEKEKKIERSPTTEVEKWLIDVEEFEDKVNSVRAVVRDDNERFCSWGTRIRLGSKVGNLLEEVETLLKAGRFPDGLVSVNNSAKPDNNVRRIGVWGTGGVGKTTLVRNLNNMLDRTSSYQHAFSIVIWITASKEVDLKRVQKQIADRLKLEMEMEESVERSAGRLHQRMEKEKFLLILDDVWDRIDLDWLGIPQPETHSGSKILLTSRLYDVCQQMGVNAEVRVDTLNHEEAWQLFSEKAGEITRQERLKPIAEAVARECCGLPLALIIVGTAMRGKKMVEQWKYALKQLQRSVPCISGVEDKVYNSLKLSYDSLEGNNIKACFLYCALYPEDFSIEVNYYPVDGFHKGTVKMHDVIRDVAIWKASSPEEKNFRSLVRSGIGLSEIPEEDLSRDSVKRVSFMDNGINQLTCSETQPCSKASTLLLQDNPIEEVPDMFLQRFPALKVLNFSRTGIKSLPPLLRLGELRAFLLQRCTNLHELPPLGVLIRLQVLNLSGTSIEELPKEMENLINLRQVNLSHTHSLRSIKAGIVSKWTRLEDFSCLDPEYLMTRIGRLKRFHFTFSRKSVHVFTSGRHEKGKVTLNWYEKYPWNPEMMMGWLLINATSLVWNGAKDHLNNIIQCLLSVRSVGTSSFDCFAALKSLTINNIRGYGSLPVGGNDVPDFLPNLEELSLESITSMQSISELVDGLGLKLYKLKTLLVFRCPHMKYLFTGENFGHQMPNLELITVSSCDKLEMLFDYNLVLQNLRILKLKGLTMLRDLCIPGESWPCLEKVYVFQCSLLRRLPLNIGNANNIQEIRGESQWWSELIWDDEETKSSLQQYYNTTAQGRSGQYREGFELEDGYSFFRRCYTPENLQNTA